VDALEHVLDAIPGLYRAGLSEDTVQRLFKAPRQGTTAARRYRQLVDARVVPARNDARPEGLQTHFGRAQQKLLQEWFAFRGQLNITGDDMNIIQVGRPAVSRYHRQRKYYGEGQGPNHDVHDFPTAELGIKMGGFMFLHSDRVQCRAMDDLDLLYK